MTQETIDRFLYAASNKLPDLITPALEQKELREVYDSAAVMVFVLDEALTLDELKEVFDETFGIVTLYHHIRSRDTDFGQSVCAFQRPGTGEMYQINASTNAHGMVQRIDVRLYESLERMVSELRSELQRMTEFPGEFFEAITEPELLSYFL